MPLPKRGWGFHFFVFRCPLLVKSGSAKTTLRNLPVFAERLLRGIKVNSSHFLLGFYKIIHRLRFYKNQVRYVLPSAYWRNRIDKLFGYQYHSSAILAERLNVQALLVFILSILPIVWRNRYFPLSLYWFCRIVYD